MHAMLEHIINLSRGVVPARVWRPPDRARRCTDHLHRSTLSMHTLYLAHALFESAARSVSPD